MMTRFILLLTFGAAMSGAAYGLPVDRAGAMAPAAARVAADPQVDVGAVEPLAAELAKRAEAGDAAYVAKLMGNGAGAEAAAAMIARIKRADVRRTFREHLEVRGAGAAGLNYHEPSHFQVELRTGAGGTWEVGRLWFCR